MLSEEETQALHKAAANLTPHDAGEILIMSRLIWSYLSVSESLRLAVGTNFIEHLQTVLKTADPGFWSNKSVS